MSKLPDKFIIFDTEFTAWEGSQARGWSAEGEYREVIQIGAVKVSGLKEIDSFLVYVRPAKNPILSDYIKELTGISQEKIDKEGMSYEQAQAFLYNWADGLTMYSFGSDASVLKENSDLVRLEFPFSPQNFGDIRPVFREHGVDTGQYMSSTIPLAFGQTAPPDGHDALNDARSILLALVAAKASD